jgi:acyl transferase domain-containing protein
VRGARVDWESVSPGPATPVRLPSAPFEGARHWYDGPLAARNGDAPVESGHPLLGRRLRLPGSAEVRFETRFSQTTPHFLGDHRLFGVSLPPAASHLSMLAEAGRLLSEHPDSTQRWRFEARIGSSAIASRRACACGSTDPEAIRFGIRRRTGKRRG